MRGRSVLLLAPGAGATHRVPRHPTVVPRVLCAPSEAWETRVGQTLGARAGPQLCPRPPRVERVPAFHPRLPHNLLFVHVLCCRGTPSALSLSHSFKRRVSGLAGLAAWVSCWLLVPATVGQWERVKSCLLLSSCRPSTFMRLVTHAHEQAHLL